MNATIHVGNGEVIENGIITFRDGKIEAVAEATAIRVDLSDYEQIDASGKHVYPGFVLASTNLGLEEISSVRATNDDREVGEITPNVRSQIAYNTDSELIPTFRFNGILLAQIAPQGGYVTGTSSIMKLDGWNWEDATYEKDDAIHVNWPSKTYGARWWLGETERRKNDNYSDQVEEITSTIRDAKSYFAMGSEKKNLKLQAMKGVVEGTKPLFVYADRAEELIASVSTLKELGIEKVVIVGGRDAYYVKEMLVEYDVPVVLDNVHRMPSRPEEGVDFPFQMPGLLADAGVTVALRHDGMLARGRNLPFYAGTAAAYGAEKEEALQMITLNPAKILGIEDRTGSLEEGKDANILISEGDILDMRSSIITNAFIMGMKLNLEGKQQRLYDRYREKYSE
jgi:imidazolonepropionase-like amidohydrolase